MVNYSTGQKHIGNMQAYASTFPLYRHDGVSGTLSPYFLHFSHIKDQLPVQYMTICKYIFWRQKLHCCDALIPGLQQVQLYQSTQHNAFTIW